MTKEEIKNTILDEVKKYNILDFISHERMFACGDLDRNLFGVHIALSVGDYGQEDILSLCQKIQTKIPEIDEWHIGQSIISIEKDYTIEFEVLVDV